MHSDRAKEALSHILIEIDLVDSFIDALNEAQFMSDPMRLRAVIRCLEVISEASRRLPTDLKDRHPLIPWLEISSAGNFYRHEYNWVLPRRIWETATSLSDLRTAIEQELTGKANSETP